MRATDPATPQPGIRPPFRAAADHVRMHPAAGLSIGLQPWKQPEPLDPIEEEEVNLVVWMGLWKRSID